MQIGRCAKATDYEQLVDEHRNMVRGFFCSVQIGVVDSETQLQDRTKPPAQGQRMKNRSSHF
jgi:hypothetical protein